MVPVFDGHNDALTREDAADFAAGRPDGDLDLPRARAGGLAGGIFALFTPSPGAEERIPTRPDGGIQPTRAPPIGEDVAAPAAGRAAGRLLVLARAAQIRLGLGPDDLDAA